MQAATSALEREPNPAVAARLSTELIDALTRSRQAVAGIRRGAVERLWPEQSYKEIAELIGVSKSLVAAVIAEVRGRNPRYRSSQ